MTRVLVHGAGRMARRVLAHMLEKENYELAAKIRDQLKEYEKPFSINDII